MESKSERWTLAVSGVLLMLLGLWMYWAQPMALS